MGTVLISPLTSDNETQESWIPPLENGDHMAAREFLRRYEAAPEIKKAELIGGIVHMASPVRVDRHADPDNMVQGWLFNYSISTPGTRPGANGTVRLSVEDVPQPDVFLRILPEYGGRAFVDAKGYLRGAPELIVEIAASSASYDAREKLQSYRRAAVQEYLLYRTQEKAVDWYALEDDEYRPIEPRADGVICSKVFPGLWLDVAALVALDGAKLVAVLQQGLASPAHQEFAESLKARFAPKE